MPDQCQRHRAVLGGDLQRPVQRRLSPVHRPVCKQHNDLQLWHLVRSVHGTAGGRHGHLHRRRLRRDVPNWQEAMQGKLRRPGRGLRRALPDRHPQLRRDLRAQPQRKQLRSDIMRRLLPTHRGVRRLLQWDDVRLHLRTRIPPLRRHLRPRRCRNGLRRQLYQLPDRSERDACMPGGDLCPGLQDRLSLVQQPVCQQHGCGHVRQHIVQRLRADDRWHSELRWSVLRAGLPHCRHQVVRHCLHPQRQCMQRRVQHAQYPQLRRSLPAQRQRQQLRRPVLALPGSHQRRRHLRRHWLRHHLQQRVSRLRRQLPGKQQRQFLRHDVHPVRSRPSERHAHLPEFDVRLHVRSGPTQVWKRLLQLLQGLRLPGGCE